MPDEAKSSVNKRQFSIYGRWAFLIGMLLLVVGVATAIGDHMLYEKLDTEIPKYVLSKGHQEMLSEMEPSELLGVWDMLVDSGMGDWQEHQLRTNQRIEAVRLRTKLIALGCAAGGLLLMVGSIITGRR